MASSNQGKQGGGDQAESSRGRSGRGFASMDPQRQREIASQGGRAAHEKGTAHEFDSEEAREAGRKGGQASHGGGGSNRGTPANQGTTQAGNQAGNQGAEQGESR